MGRAKIIGTWRFSAVGVTAGAQVILDGGSALSAVVAGVREVELDETVTSAGFGGLPNAAGVLQLDAAVMTGDGRVGAVMALGGCRAAAPVAEAVLQKSRHAMLAGDGATAFAAAHGFPIENNESLLSVNARNKLAAFLQLHASQESSEPKLVPSNEYNDDSTQEMSHTDTVGMICVDQKGDLAAACATSGLQFKDAGRVGDSPLIGCGVYVDAKAGAAVASGDGDQMIRYCLSVTTVELMRRGASAQEACDTVMKRVFHADQDCQAAICAMTPDGNTGMSCTRTGFYTAEWTHDSPDAQVMTPVITEAPSVSRSESWKHTCV